MLSIFRGKHVNPKKKKKKRGSSHARSAYDENTVCVYYVLILCPSV